MGRKSVKENKSIYQQAREEMGLTRAQASELTGGLSESQIEKIESGKTRPQPEDVLLMAEAYKNPYLCNYYCAKECAIGESYVPEVDTKELPQIVLETLAALNSVTSQKDRLIEISADGELSEDEIEDFVKIQKQLQNISTSFQALNLWVEKTVATGKVDERLVEKR